jgi:hypothetical protein
VPDGATPRLAALVPTPAGSCIVADTIKHIFAGLSVALGRRTTRGDLLDREHMVARADC